MTTRVAYDQVAPDYDRRYRHGGLPGVEGALARATRADRRPPRARGGLRHRALAARVRSASGCSAPIAPWGCWRERPSSGARPPSPLLAAEAHALPFSTPAFDLVACVNALHHFGEPRRFLERATGAAARRRRPGRHRHGSQRRTRSLVSLRLLPRVAARPTSIATRRTPRSGAGCATSASSASRRATAQRIQGVFQGERVFDDPILHRHGTSQLTLLDDAAFERGMARIHDAVATTGPAAGVRHRHLCCR